MCRLRQLFFQRLDEFIRHSSDITNPSPDVQQTAFCFLAARKFSVPQALELYQNYHNDHENSGARVAQLFVRLHRSSGNHRALLQSILFQLNATFRKEVAARSGLVFIYDMTDAKFGRIDCAFGIKLFNILQFNYPVRLRRVLILTAPLWFRASFGMMRSFIRDQLRDTVCVLRPSPGSKLDALSHPDLVSLRRDHYAWLQTALTRTGWLLTDKEQTNRPPHASRAQTAAAFFGLSQATSAAGLSSGSMSDVSDSPDSREDDEDSICSSSPMDEEDLLSDMDPFTLSSSYSSEADNIGGGAAEPGDSCSAEVNEEKLIPSDSVSGHQETALKRRKGSTMSHSETPLSTTDETHRNHVPSDHAETPTPPSVAKRLVLPTLKSTLDKDKDMGFSEHTSPLSTMESTTPTTEGEEFVVPSAVTEVPPAGKLMILRTMLTRNRNSAGTESSCSSTTSFLSTGSAAFGAISSDASPTAGEQVFPRVVMTRAHVNQVSSAPTTTTGLDGAGRSVRTTDSAATSPRPVILTVGSMGSSAAAERIAPLAEDEIGDQTMRNDERQPRLDPNGNGMGSEDGDSDTSTDHPTCPPTRDNLPDWAVGRPIGDSIHQAPIRPPTHEADPVNPVSVDTNHHSASSLPFADETTSQLSIDKPDPDATSIANNLKTPKTETNMGDVNHNECDATHVVNGVSIEKGLASVNEPDQSDVEEMSAIAQEEASKSNSSEGDDDEAADDDELYEISDEFESEPEISLDDYWMNPSEIARHVSQVGLSGIQAEYNAVNRIRSDDTRNAFKHGDNRDKNRYSDVFCFEASRVHLRPLTTQWTSPGLSKVAATRPNALQSARSTRHGPVNLHRAKSAPTSSKDLTRNYIHANWVDGYRQKNAFICTQGPLPETVADFWQMIWDYHVPILIMITRVFEADRVKCYPYWPESSGQKLGFASGHPGVIRTGGPERFTPSALPESLNARPEFEIENMCRQTEDHFTRCTLRLTHVPTGKSRTVNHFAYSTWPDHGVPRTTEGLQQLLSRVQHTYDRAIRRLGYTSYVDQEVPPPPVVVHCSAGIGRTGTYVTADVCTKWLVDPDRPNVTETPGSELRINIPLTVSRIRSQRCGCVQVATQYAFCYRVLLDFAHRQGLLDAESVELATAHLTPPAPSQSFVGSTSMYQPSTLSYANQLRGRQPYPTSTSFLGPRSRIGNAMAEIRHLLPTTTTHLFSIWQAMRAGKSTGMDSGRPGGCGGVSATLEDMDFVMTENVCSSDETEEEEEYEDEELEEADLSSDRASPDSPNVDPHDSCILASEVDKVSIPVSQSPLEEPIISVEVQTQLSAPSASASSDCDADPDSSALTIDPIALAPSPQTTIGD